MPVWGEVKNFIQLWRIKLMWCSLDIPIAQQPETTSLRKNLSPPWAMQSARCQNMRCKLFVTYGMSRVNPLVCQKMQEIWPQWGR